jgi:hypothetical protein
MHLTAIQLSGLILAAYWLFSALVDEMPVPTEKSSTRYRYAFGVLHRLAGNLRRAAEQRFGALVAEPSANAKGA